MQARAVRSAQAVDPCRGGMAQVLLYEYVCMYVCNLSYQLASFPFCFSFVLSFYVSYFPLSRSVTQTMPMPRRAGMILAGAAHFATLPASCPLPPAPCLLPPAFAFLPCRCVVGIRLWDV